MAHPRPSAQLQWGVSHHATSDPQGRANAVLFHHKKKKQEAAFGGACRRQFGAHGACGRKNRSEWFLARSTHCCFVLLCSAAAAKGRVPKEEGGG